MKRTLLGIVLVAGWVAAQSDDRPPVLKRKPAEKTEEKQPEEKPKSTDPAKPADAAKETAPPAEGADEDANYPRTQRPVKPAADSRDPGAPKLKRGTPARRTTSSTPEPEPEPDPILNTAPAPAAAPASPAPGSEAARPPQQVYREVVTDAEGNVERESRPLAPAGDPLIEKARMFAALYIERLPNFICDQMTFRSVSETLVPKWKVKDRVELELLYSSGKEDYRNIRMNGKALKKGSPEDSGTWSTGEFGAIIAALFFPGTDAKFKLRGDSTAAGLKAKIYDFAVTADRSAWTIRIGRSIKPAYKGSVWIDVADGQVLRIEQNTRALPSDYQVDTVETTIDYGFVLISGQRFLLPVKSANLSCQRGGFYCTMNEIEFRNYRKFAVESQVLATDSEISFPEAEDPKKPASKTIPPSLTDPTIPKTDPPKKKN